MIKRKERNWLLAGVASIWIVLSAVVVLIGILNFQAFGWLIAILMIVVGIVSVSLGLVAIIKNDPAWLLLDMILHG